MKPENTLIDIYGYGIVYDLAMLIVQR